MTNDEQVLTDINKKMIDAENNGDVEWLLTVLAPRLAFQRADGTIDDQVAFLQKAKAGGTRKLISIDSIALFGDRAVVQCIVKVGDQEFHNLRLFVRREGQWKLLGWANEPHGTS